MDAVRAKLKRYPRKFPGSESQTQRDALSATEGLVKASHLIGTITTLEVPTHALIRKFERMCTISNRPIPDELRPAVYRLLATELFANSVMFRRHGAMPQDLVSSTAYQGNMGALCQEFHNAPRALVEAVKRHPLNPRSYMEKRTASGRSSGGIGTIGRE